MTENETQQPDSTQFDAEDETSADVDGDFNDEYVKGDEDADGDEETDQRDNGADEGDIAADYLEELLDIVDLDGDIDIEVRGGRTYISIVADEGGEELDSLVGRRGEVLDALQELTRLAVLTSTGSRTRMVLDISGHRQERHGELQKLAEKAIKSVQDDGDDVHLEPMSAYERKIVHDFVAEADLISESEGEGKRRHVVVSAN